jgi:integrase
MATTVREKPKGSGIYYIYIHHNGRRKAKKVGKDKRLAHELAKKIDAKFLLGECGLLEDKKSAITFQTYAEKWLEDHVALSLGKRTYERYKDALRLHINPVLGHKALTEIKRADVKKLLVELRKKGKSRGFLGIIHAAISGPFYYAIDEEVLSVNPANGMMKRVDFRQDSCTETFVFLSKEEVDLFLQVCRKEFPELYPFFLCAFRTGMRLGELLALKWGDISWGGKYVEVNRSYNRGEYGPTKTRRSRRVDMSDQLQETLRTIYKSRVVVQFPGESDTKPDLGLIFQRNGKPFEQNRIRRILKAILIRAEMKDMRFHDIRHTYASILLSSNNVNLVYVKDQMGHKSIQTTVDIYGHLIPGSNQGLVNCLDSHPTATPAQPGKIEKA